MCRVLLIQMPRSTVLPTRRTVLFSFRKHLSAPCAVACPDELVSTTFALSYGLSFASITATLMHAFLYFRKQIWAQSRRSMREQEDIHARLMSKYKQVPGWWYMVIFGGFPFSILLSMIFITSPIASMFVIGIISIEFWHTEFPVWAFCLSLAIGISASNVKAF